MRLDLGSISQGTVHVIESDCSGHAHSLVKGKNSKLLREYSAHGSDVLCLEDALQTVMGEAYAGQAWGLEGDGMHSTARQSPSGLVWRNWLPGPLGHQFLADCTSMLLFRALRLMGTLSKNEETPVLPVALKPPPLCFALHQPHFGEEEIKDVQVGSWRRLPGEGAREDDLPPTDDDHHQQPDPECAHPDMCGYYEARGSSAGNLIFTIPPQETLPNRRVYVCCCCNSDLCIDEQFLPSVTFTWLTPVTTVSFEEARRIAQEDSSVIAGNECLLIATNMPFANQLTISISVTKVNVPVRIAKVIAG